MHDIHNIWTFGTSDEAMALAVNTLAAQGGGWVLVREGEVIATIVYEIGGIMSQRPPDVVAKETEAFADAADTLQWMPPPKENSRNLPPGFAKYLTAAFLTCSPWNWVIVAPNDEDPVGLVNVTTGERHPIVW
jgi:adenine deaminase